MTIPQTDSNGGVTINGSQNNPFWLALANKADSAADEVESVNRAETNYLVCRTEIVGDDLLVHLPGMLQHQANMRISQPAATLDYNKGTVEAAGQRDRTLANARTNLAAAKGTWEQGLVSQTPADMTLKTPSLNEMVTTTIADTARQLSMLFTGGVVSTTSFTLTTDRHGGLTPNRSPVLDFGERHSPAIRVK